MKTIEGLRNYAESEFVAKTTSGVNPLAECIARLSFCAGWEVAVKELLCWHDPKVELPEPDVEVLVKIDALHNKYDIMKHNQHGWWQEAPGGGWCAAEHTPIGWRYIHEI